MTTAAPARQIFALVTNSSSNSLAVHDLAAGAKVVIRPRPGNVHGPEWSPDGSLIAFSDGDDLVLIPATEISPCQPEVVGVEVGHPERVGVEQTGTPTNGDPLTVDRHLGDRLP